MLRFDKYVRPSSVSVALQVLQEEPNVTVLGGMLWLRLANRSTNCALDLSDCNLNHIEQTEREFIIGAMVSLNQLQHHCVFTKETNGVFRDAVKDIVGVQFRNLATVGGSVWAKMGFSDIVTALLALDTEVVLAQAGRISLKDFLAKAYPHDLLTHIIVKRRPYHTAFACVRNTKTDFSSLNVAVGFWDNRWHIALGARPQKAQLLEDLDLQYFELTEDDHKLLTEAIDSMSFGSDRRADALWRQTVAHRLVDQALTQARKGVA